MSQETELILGGMTCASCANRIERKLNKLDGVSATVNYATEKARVTSDGVATEDLIAAVEAAGYTATLPAAEPVDELPTDPLKQRLIVSAVLSVPVIAMAMIPALQFTNWQWLSLTLAAPVVVWGALPFHRAAWTNLRHGTSTMDTLVSMGTLAALGWSLYTVLRYRRHTRYDASVRVHDRANGRGRQHLPRSRSRRDHLHPGRTMVREPIQASGRCGVARPDGPRCQDGCRTERR